MTVGDTAELEKLKAIGRICARVLEAMGKAIEPGMTTQELDDLGASLLAPSGNISSLLDRMEADEMVQRVPDPGDRRRYLIRMTNQGLDQFHRMAQANVEWVADAFSDIDDDTLERLHHELSSIASNANKHGT